MGFLAVAHMEIALEFPWGSLSACDRETCHGEVQCFEKNL